MDGPPIDGKSLAPWLLNKPLSVLARELPADTLAQLRVERSRLGLPGSAAADGVALALPPVRAAGLVVF